MLCFKKRKEALLHENVFSSESQPMAYCNFRLTDKVIVMSDISIKHLQRAIDERPKGGMQTGIPKITLREADAVRLIAVYESIQDTITQLQQRKSELERERDEVREKLNSETQKPTDYLLSLENSCDQLIRDNSKLRGERDELAVKHEFGCRWLRKIDNYLSNSKGGKIESQSGLHLELIDALSKLSEQDVFNYGEEIISAFVDGAMWGDTEGYLEKSDAKQYAQRKYGTKDDD